MTDIVKSHPRYESLMLREKLVDGFWCGAVVVEGLIAQGRGEAFDYILGEKTCDAARSSIRAAAAALILAKKPVISVNGNAAALVADECIRLSRLLGCPIEVNLFYRSHKREKIIERILKDAGADSVLGVENDASASIPGLEHPRGRVSPRGIYTADVVLVPLEDGDRTQALRDMGKTVITVDLNPFSRSAQTASITIVDNITRCYPELCGEIKRLKAYERSVIEKIIKEFDNKKNLRDTFTLMKKRLDKANAGDFDG